MVLSLAGCGGGLYGAPDDPASYRQSHDQQVNAEAHSDESAPETIASTPPPPPAPPERHASAPMPKPSAPAPTSSAPSGYGWNLEPHLPPPPVLEEERPRERPGLATVWGETRYSRAHEVDFERADAPFAVASLYYNDRDGASAMAAPDVRAAGRIDSAVPMRGGLTISVVDEYGSPFESFSLGGRVYVVGENGRRYSLVLHNQTGRRYEVVASVDGLDVVDGKPAATTKRGYLIDPWGSLTIDGFRRTTDEVAAFRFGAVKDSYAAKTGNDRNVGVIGVALFAERGAPAWSDDEVWMRRSAEPFVDGRFAQPPPN